MSACHVAACISARCGVGLYPAAARVADSRRILCAELLSLLRFGPRCRVRERRCAAPTPINLGPLALVSRGSDGQADIPAFCPFDGPLARLVSFLRSPGPSGKYDRVRADGPGTSLSPTHRAQRFPHAPTWPHFSLPFDDSGRVPTWLAALPMSLRDNPAGGTGGTGGGTGTGRAAVAVARPTSRRARARRPAISSNGFAARPRKRSRSCSTSRKRTRGAPATTRQGAERGRGRVECRRRGGVQRVQGTRDARGREKESRRTRPTFAARIASDDRAKIADEAAPLAGFNPAALRDIVRDKGLELSFAEETVDGKAVKVPW
jgi:hypothetical protein